MQRKKSISLLQLSQSCLMPLKLPLQEISPNNHMKLTLLETQFHFCCRQHYAHLYLFLRSWLQTHNIHGTDTPAQNHNLTWNGRSRSLILG